VVAVTGFPYRESLEADVVLDVGGRDDDRPRLRFPEERAFHRREAVGLEVLDHLHQYCRVEPPDPSIPVRQGGLEERQPFTLARRHRRQVKAPGRRFQRPNGDVNAGDPLEGAILHQRLEELSASAPEVDHGSRSGSAERGDHCADPLVGEAHRSFERSLLGVTGRLLGVGVIRVVRESGECLAGQRRTVAEVASRDQIAVGVGTEPLAALVEELLDLATLHPVVLVVVHHRKQDVEVAKEFPNPHGPHDPEVEVATITPGREVVIKRDRGRGHLVPQGFEQPADELFTSPAGHDRKVRLEREGSLGKLGPVLASSRECRTEQLGDRDAHERGGDVRSVVHVVGERERLPAASTPDQADRVDFQQERHRAPLGGRFRIQDVRLPVGDVDRPDVLGILVQKETEVGCRRGRGRDREEHGRATLAAPR
jgi:hypothetical protein